MSATYRLEAHESPRRKVHNNFSCISNMPQGSSPEHAAGSLPLPKGPVAALAAQTQPEQPDSALLVKSMEAFRYSAHAYVPPGQEPPGETSSMAAGGQALLGIAGAGLRCSWRGGTRTLVLAGKVSPQSHSLCLALHGKWARSITGLRRI